MGDGETESLGEGARGPCANWFPCSYNTTSNLTRVVKTPGGALRVLHIKKRGTAPKCGDCGIKLPGVSGLAFMHMG
jgi:ribosomal protein L34E